MPVLQYFARYTYRLVVLIGRCTLTSIFVENPRSLVWCEPVRKFQDTLILRDGIAMSTQQCCSSCCLRRECKHGICIVCFFCVMGKTRCICLDCILRSQRIEYLPA